MIIALNKGSNQSVGTRLRLAFNEAEYNTLAGGRVNEAWRAETTVSPEGRVVVTINLSKNDGNKIGCNKWGEHRRSWSQSAYNFGLESDHTIAATEFTPALKPGEASFQLPERFALQVHPTANNKTFLARHQKHAQDLLAQWTGRKASGGPLFESAPTPPPNRPLKDLADTITRASTAALERGEAVSVKPADHPAVGNLDALRAAMMLFNRELPTLPAGGDIEVIVDISKGYPQVSLMRKI